MITSKYQFISSTTESLTTDHSKNVLLLEHYFANSLGDELKKDIFWSTFDIKFLFDISSL